MEEFSKQKIAWNRIASEKLFSYVDEDIFIQDSMHFFTGEHLEYLCSMLNSKLFSWYLYLIIGDAAGGNAGNSDNIKNLYVIKTNENIENKIHSLYLEQEYEKIDNFIFRLYNLSEEEENYLNNCFQ